MIRTVSVFPLLFCGPLYAHEGVLFLSGSQTLLLEIVLGVFIVLLLIAYRKIYLKRLHLQLQRSIEKEREQNLLYTKQTIQHSRLVQMGQMLNMIAHQWRQPLSAISATANNIQLQLLMEQENKKALLREVDLINKYAKHLSQTINDFRNFFKTDKQEEEVRLQEILDDTLDIVKPLFAAKKITLIKRFDADPVILTFANEIKQVLLNLLKNAEEILEERNIEEKKITVALQESRQEVVLSVEDNGGGIGERHLNYIFDPYFSTKKGKDGTGLGLYMSKLIMEDHCKGRIKASNSAEGALFSLHLPKARLVL